VKFAVFSVNRQTGEKRVFEYDNTTNALSDNETGEVFEYEQKMASPVGNRSFSPTNPLKKSKKVHLLKVQLGLSCNYACDYCSQRFVERPKETSKKDLDNFFNLLETLEFSEEEGLKIEFWGGEPLVYWKTLKPLVERFDNKFKDWKQKPRKSIITNGSLLNQEISMWLVYNDFSVAVSHDGPGHATRGPELENWDEVLKLYKILAPAGRMTFNAMMHKGNMSRKAVYDWFVEKTGDVGVIIGEGSLVDAYDEGGRENSLNTFAEHFAFRKQAFKDAVEHEGNLNADIIPRKVNAFVQDILNQTSSESVNQKCGMDGEDVIAIDLRGNVLTCQNVSVAEERHNGGNLAEFDKVEITAGTHWKERPHCAACPMLHLCHGSCLFLEGENWATSCDNAYTDSVAFFAVALEKITGFTPMYVAPVEGELPAHRRDLWGDLLKHEEKPKKKVFKIHASTAN